jgi:diguanylate cyclase (GGDEF)-like protein
VVVEHLRAALGMPIMLDKQALTLHCSIGIAGYPDDGKTVDELLSCADHALYRNKSGAGRQRNS